MLDYSDCPSDYGYFHESEIPDCDQLRDHVLGILESLYKTGDMKQIESSLEEICHELEMPFNPTTPLLVKRDYVDVMGSHLGYQREIINKMSGVIK